MSRRHYSPAYLRYFKARLWNLARPGFWGSAIFLCVVAVVIREYWTHPDFLTNWRQNQVATQKPTQQSFSAEDRAIAADIDNFPLLFSDSEPGTSPLTTTNPDQNTEAKNDKNLIEVLTSKSQTSASDAKSKTGDNQASFSSSEKSENPFLKQAENLLQLNNFQNSNKQLGVAQQGTESSLSLETGLGNTTNALTNTTALENPLQTALDQSINQNKSGRNSTASTQTNPFSQTILPTNTIPGQTSAQGTGLSSGRSNLYTGTNSTQPGLTTPPPNPLLGTYTQPGLTTPPPNPLLGTYTQPGLTTQQPNAIPGTISTQPGAVNLVPPNPVFATGYIQPGQPNVSPYSASETAFRAHVLSKLRAKYGLDSGSVPPNLPQQPVLSPGASTVPTNTLPYYNPIPNPGNVTYTTPVVPNNYGTSTLQQPPQLPQYNYSSPSQIPSQYTTGVQTNGYPYP